MVIRKTEVSFAMVDHGLPSPTTGGTLFKFTVNADSAGAVEVKQLGFTLTTTGVTVTALKLYNSETGTAINDTGVEGNVIKLLVGGAGDDDLITVSAGGSKDYEVRGTVADWGATGDELQIKFTEDSSLVTNGAAAIINASSNNTWSDRSASNHATTTSDWTNGYLLRDMTGVYTFIKL
jgi:hypothetical protein